VWPDVKSGLKKTKPRNWESLNLGKKDEWWVPSGERLLMGTQNGQREGFDDLRGNAESTGMGEKV